MDLSLPNFSSTCLVSFLFAPTVVTPQTAAMLLIVLINALEKSWLQSVSSESGQIMTNSVNGGFQGNGMKIFMKNHENFLGMGLWGNSKLFTLSSGCYASVFPDYDNCKVAHFYESHTAGEWGLK